MNAYTEVKTKDLRNFLSIAKKASAGDRLASVVFSVRPGTNRLSVQFSSYFVSGTTLFACTDHRPPVLVGLSDLDKALKICKGKTLRISWSECCLTLDDGNGEKKVTAVLYDGHDLNYVVAGTQEIDSKTLLETLPAMLAIVTDESPRSYGTVIKAEIFNGKLRFVATDGFRLAYSVSKEIEAKSVDLCLTARAAKCLFDLAKVAPDKLFFHVSDDKTLLFVSSDSVYLNFRLSPVKFPSYERAIPEKTVGQKFPVKALEGLIKNALMFAGKNSAILLSSLDGQLSISAKKSESDKGESFSLKLEEPFNTFPIALNGQFILDALKTTKEISGEIFIGKTCDEPITLALGKVSTVLVPIINN